MTGNSAVVRYLWSVYRCFKVRGVWHEDNGQLSSPNGRREQQYIVCSAH